ncbi:MAG: DUF4252 domain-containing protein [Bacteroidales bacterium]|nr:DUF4252 domain-containing protein [Candidatus Cryptobacteroides caccocaballi]
MKRIIMIAMLAIVSFTAFAQTSRDIYEKYSDMPGTSAVYISPLMFKMMKALPDMHVGSGKDVNITSMIASLDGMFILEVEGSAAKGLNSEAEKLVKSGKFGLMMEAKDNGENTRIYSVEKGEYITDLVLLTSGGSETTFIAISGKLRSDDIARLLED